MLETTKEGTVDQLVGWLATLQSDLHNHHAGTPKVSIDDLIDDQYTGLKKLCYDLLVDIDHLNVQTVERLEGIGITVVLDRATLNLTIYMGKGHFIIKHFDYHVDRVGAVLGGIQDLSAS